ncbi:MAG: glycosyltransferase family 9 protein [Bdellovibrionota bacterium]
MAPNKILALKLRSLGDTVVMSAPLLELRKAFPHAEIHVCVSNVWAEILENHPAIDRLWKLRPTTADLIRMARRLRKESFDVAINFHASSSSAILSRLTGASSRAIHFHDLTKPNRFSTVKIDGKGTIKPITERDMDAVRALGIHISPGRLPVIYTTKQEDDWAEKYIASHNSARPVLGIGLAASRPAKSWPVERFAALAASWCKKTNGSVLALAGEDESDLMYKFLACSERHPKEYSGSISGNCSFSLRELAAITKRLAVFVGNDSGPRHVAAAVGTPTITIFGPEHPFEWHPYPSDKHPYLFIESLDCRRHAMAGMPKWCGVTHCTEKQHKCMTLIGIENVLAKCLLLSKECCSGELCETSHNSGDNYI